MRFNWIRPADHTGSRRRGLWDRRNFRERVLMSPTLSKLDEASAARGQFTTIQGGLGR